MDSQNERAARAYVATFDNGSTTEWERQEFSAGVWAGPNETDDLQDGVITGLKIHLPRNPEWRLAEGISWKDDVYHMTSRSTTMR